MMLPTKEGFRLGGWHLDRRWASLTTTDIGRARQLDHDDLDRANTLTTYRHQHTAELTTLETERDLRKHLPTDQRHTEDLDRATPGAQIDPTAALDGPAVEITLAKPTPLDPSIEAAALRPEISMPER